MKTAADVLKTKADQAVYTITPDDTVFDAVKLMADRNIGALLVFEGSELAGMRTSEECMALMTETRVRHLPVMDGAKLLGVISIGDLVKDIISEQKFIIEQLEHYISGDRG